MAISRMQEPRQLYGLGSLVKKITRPIKKAVKGVGKIAKSPLGKMALLAAAGYGLGAVGPGGFSKARMLSRLGLGSLTPSTAILPGTKTTPSFLSTLNPFGSNFSLKNLGFTAGAAGAILPFVAPNLLAPKEEDMEEIDYTVQPSGITELVEQAKDYYRTGGDGTLNYMPNIKYVTPNFYDYANGGRVGFDRGGLGALGGMMQPGKSKSKDLDLMTIKATLNQVYTNNDDGEGGGYEAVMKFMEENPDYKVNIMENIIGDRGDKIRVAPIEKTSVNILDRMDDKDLSLQDGVLIINSDMFEKKSQRR